MNTVHVPQVGDKIETWFSNEKDGKSTVLKVEPYRGKYPQWFTHVLKLSAPNTRAGSLEMSYDSRHCAA